MTDSWHLPGQGCADCRLGFERGELGDNAPMAEPQLRGLETAMRHRL